MADFNSSLPIRTEVDGDAVVKIVDKDGANKAAVNASNEQLVKDTDVETALTDGSQKTKITDGTDDLGVNPDGSINVNVVDSSAGDQKHIFGTAVAGVPNTPNTVVDYTVTALKTFLIKAIQFAGSGKVKVELKAGVAASETTRAVAFTSTANPFGEIVFPAPIEVAAGEKILIVITNKDTANQDLYAFLNGIEV